MRHKGCQFLSVLNTYAPLSLLSLTDKRIHQEPRLSPLDSTRLDSRVVQYRTTGVWIGATLVSFVSAQASREWRETELETRRMIATSHLSSVGTATAQVVLVGASSATEDVDDVNLQAVGSAVSELCVCSCNIILLPFSGAFYEYILVQY